MHQNFIERQKNYLLPVIQNFSCSGNEIAWGTIGNASTSEGLFWETINAAGVLQVPMLVSIWDDGYGISVPNELQTTKNSIYKILTGFQFNKEEGGLEIFQVSAYDFNSLVKSYQQASLMCRQKHIPCIIHVKDMSQPQGHSTSGSHERYKSKQRLAHEKKIDCISKFEKMILEETSTSKKSCKK